MSIHDVFETSYDRSAREISNGVEKGELTNPFQEQSFSQSTLLKYSEKADLQHTFPSTPDLVCFSHLRWDFVYQRPQHLLSRCALTRRVFFVEEPIASPDDSWWLDISQRQCGVWVVVPYLPKDLREKSAIALQKLLIDTFLNSFGIEAPILWYYTPMAVPFTCHLQASAIVYDCMDELAAFKGAHPELQKREAQLFKLADLVFTGGLSLYEAKRHQHPSIYPFPSSINLADFTLARQLTHEPVDQASIPHPRLGFYGVIDERMDLTLLSGIAKSKPDWHIVLIGPVAKVDPALLPRYPNIHYLGSKSYQELPSYLASWDVALLPFARNESTRFISPTKTPEYLAAGRPVVSTSIKDVERPYGEKGFVHIADTLPDFITAISAALDQNQTDPDWLSRVDSFLSKISWDQTWQAMSELIEEAIARRSQLNNDQPQQKSATSAQATFWESKQLISAAAESNKLKL